MKITEMKWLVFKDRVLLKMLLIRIFTGNSIILSIRILYMLQFGLAASDISILKAVFSIAVAFTEVPTGVFADRMGKKISLVLSCLFFIAHAVIYLCWPTYAGFVLVQILLAFSSSFKSGSDIAYIKYYINENGKYEFMEIQGELMKLSKYTSAIMSVASSALFIINFRLNFILLSIFGTISFFSTTSLPLDVRQENKSRTTILKTLKTYISGSVKEIIGNKPFLSFIIITSLNFSFLIFNFEYYQFFLKELNFPVEYNGILYFSFMLLMAFRVNLTKRLKKNHSARHIYTAYTAATALSYLLIASNISIIFMIAAIIIQQVCFGGWNLLLDSVMVEESSDDRICTVVSVNNLLINLSKALIVVALGIFMQFTGIRLIYVLLSAILSISIFFLYLKKILIRRYL